MGIFCSKIENYVRDSETGEITQRMCKVGWIAQGVSCTQVQHGMDFGDLKLCAKGEVNAGEHCVPAASSENIGGYCQSLPECDI